MKQLFILIATLTSLAASAQAIDSNTMKVSLTMQARDWVYLSANVKHMDDFERLYDSVKSRAWVLNDPQSTVSAKIDSISVGNLISIARALRSRDYGVSVFVFTRINNAIRAVSNPYLQSQLDVMDQKYIDAYDAVLNDELQRLKKVHYQ